MPLVTSVLACHEASQFTQFQRLVSGNGVQRFLLLGRFDHLTLAVGSGEDEHAWSNPIASNARAASGCSYVGRLVGDGEFDPVEWVEELPLLGHCSLRLARRILRESGSFGFLIDYLETRLKPFKELRWAVISGTGWEDVTVLFFGRSFNVIKRAVGVLRAMSVNEIATHLPDNFKANDGLHHIVLTSCTLPGMALPGWTPGWTREHSEAFLAGTRHDERLHWAVRVETYPGHWDAFIALLRENSDAAGLEINVSPLFGQADARVTPAGDKETTHSGLVRFLTEVMFPIEAMPDTVVRTVETRLIPESLDYHEDTTATPSTTRTRPRAGSCLEDFNRQSKNVLLSLGVPPHTLDALSETISHIEDMAGDRLHGEEFTSMLRLADAFNTRIGRESPVFSDLRSYQIQARETQIDISDWQMTVERCLADRFRGPYPAGDSMMVRLGNHPGAHQRFLVVMDYFGQQAFDLACRQMRLIFPDPPIVPAALATFIGNSPSAYATSHLIRRLNCGFTDVPAHMVTRLQDLPLMAHETGHHLFRAFLSSFPEVEAAISSLTEECQRDIREFFAECFASHLCFPGVPEDQETAAYQTIGGYYKGIDTNNVFVRSIMVEITLRMKAVNAWIQNPESPEPVFDRLINEYRSRMEKTPLFLSPHGERVNERIHETRTALSEVRRLSKNHPEFDALMRALANCGGSSWSVSGEPENEFLSVCRVMMKTPPTTGEESLTQLDRLWFIALRQMPQVS
ncbi:MAG: hypothetical protein JNJ70_22260 [Verrucomicrobiales bacterium]|nr:hypothetical protein [Verrucomicrobiales bacterium]